MASTVLPFEEENCIENLALLQDLCYNFDTCPVLFRRGSPNLALHRLLNICSNNVSSNFYLRKLTRPLLFSEYPWSESKTLRGLQEWMYLPDPDFPPNARKLMCKACNRLLGANIGLRMFNNRIVKQ